MEIRDEFLTRPLNEDGKAKAVKLEEAYSILLDAAEMIAGDEATPELDAMRHYLQESCFWAKQAMAADPENQTGPHRRRGGTT